MRIHAYALSHSRSRLCVCGLGAHVAKFQLACDHRGTPIFWTGPHIGTVHDMKLWERHPAPLDPRERWLADKAYNKKGHAELIYMYPHKKPRGSGLTLRQKSFNTGMSWYRTTVEHSIGTRTCVFANAFALVRVRLRSFMSQQAT